MQVTFGDVAIVVCSFLIDIVFFHQIFNIDLFWFLELILLFFLNILLHNFVDLPRRHVFFYFLRQLVKDTFVFDSNPEQSLFKFFKSKSNGVVLMGLLLFCKMSEYFC